jgi:hypothetical protein
MPEPKIVEAIQPWIDAYDTWAQTPGQTSDTVTLPAIPMPAEFARVILKALTGDQDA